jgi:large subunit ribosomal protein L25
VRFELHGEARDGFGRSISRRLRRQGRVPAIIYGGGKDPRAITLSHNTTIHDMEREAFYTSILTLNVGKESQAVVVKAVQRHPAKPLIMHIDFQRVVEDEEITLNVPIHFIGEENAIGVKDQGGVIEHMETDVEITCLPRYLPEFLELDVSNLELNDLLNLSDIKLPEGVTSVALEHGTDLPVVAINPPRREEEEPTEAEEGEVPAGEVPAATDVEESEDAKSDD